MVLENIRCLRVGLRIQTKTQTHMMKWRGPGCGTQWAQHFGREGGSLPSSDYITSGQILD